MTRPAALPVALAIAAAACGSAPPPAATTPGAASAATRVGPGLVAALDAAAQERAPWRCAALDGGSGEDSLATGGRTWKLSARTLARDGAASESLAVGVIGDAAGAAPATLAALGRLRSKLDAAHVDVVLVLGGMGDSRADIEGTLGALATKAAWPVVALPGDLEPAGAHAEAIAALRARGVPVFDGRLARWIELSAVTIGTLPGAGAAERLVAGADGCAYSADELAALTDALSAKPGVRVLATAEAPRGIAAGEPTGELALLRHAAIDVVVHGAADAATSPATGGRDGNAVALAPGPADALARLPGPPRPPTAGILAIHGGQWSWRTVADAK